MGVSDVKIRSPKSIAARLGVCTQTVFNMVTRGEFPRAVRVSENRLGFIEHEVDDWIAQRIAERDAAAGSPTEVGQLADHQVRTSSAPAVEGKK